MPRDSDVRFWLALALARFGVDHELKAIFEELQQGQHYRFASVYSGTLADLSASTLDYPGAYLTLRKTLRGLRLPALTRGWLSAIAATGEASQAGSLATALLEAFDTSSLDPPMARGDGVRFVRGRLPRDDEPTARCRAVRGVVAHGGSGRARRLVLTDIQRARHDTGPGSGLAPAVITALFRRAARAWDINLGTHIVGWVQRHQANFRPDLGGCREYWRLSVREVARYSSSDDGTVGFVAGWDEYDSLYRWLGWQIAWTASRGGSRGLATGLAAHFQSSKPTSGGQQPCCRRRRRLHRPAERPDLRRRPGPPRHVVTQGVVEGSDRLIAAGEAGPARIDVVRGAFLYKVWYATSRAPVDPADPTRGFTNNRDGGGTVRFGTCTVQVPKAHQFGSIGTTLYRRVLRLRFSDDHLKIVGRTPIDPTDSSSLPYGGNSQISKRRIGCSWCTCTGTTCPSTRRPSARPRSALISKCRGRRRSSAGPRSALPAPIRRTSIGSLPARPRSPTS